MPERSMVDILDSMADLVDDLDQIARTGHDAYRAYDPAHLIEHDARVQATCIYCHMLAEADRRFANRAGVRPLDIKGLKVWHFLKEDVVIRLKKMDEDGRARRYPTRQAKNFDAGCDLPGLPAPPVRLTAGYWLDPTGTVILRTQLAQPAGRDVLWCAAIVPASARAPGERRWEDVTRQGRFG